MKGVPGSTSVPIGHRFGFLVVKKLQMTTLSGHQRYVVACDCGKMDYAWSFALRGKRKVKCVSCMRAKRTPGGGTQDERHNSGNR